MDWWIGAGYFKGFRVGECLIFCRVCILRNPLADTSSHVLCLGFACARDVERCFGEGVDHRGAVGDVTLSGVRRVRTSDEVPNKAANLLN